MSERLGYTFYPKDFISDPDVMMMTSAQRGVYRDLIDLAYMNDNKIKYNLQQLSKYCNANEDEISYILSLKGVKSDDFWTIPSCNKRISKAVANRTNGAKGGRPKKPKKNPSNNPNTNPSETQLERQREREREKEYKESSFNIFWSKYPKKTAKSNCKPKFLKLRTEEIKTILETIDKFVAYKPFESYNHPNPETYLNQKRWEDELAMENKERKDPNYYKHYDTLADNVRKQIEANERTRKEQ